VSHMGGWFEVSHTGCEVLSHYVVIERDAKTRSVGNRDVASINNRFVDRSILNLVNNVAKTFWKRLFLPLPTGIPERRPRTYKPRAQR
jgi:hypothetical protein